MNMTGRGIAYIILLLLLQVHGGCSRRDSDRSVSSATYVQTKRHSADRTEDAYRWADSVLNGMTLEEMAGQLVMPAVFAESDEASLARLERYVADSKVGGVAFHKGDTLSMKRISRMLQARTRVPLFLAIDAETGLGMRLEGAAVYPANYKLSGETQEGMYEYGNAVGRDCKGVGLNMVFGPVLDVAEKPSSYMYRRSLGSDPVRVADLGTAYARGMADAGIMPVGKHFPGHGRTDTDSHERLPVLSFSADELRKVDLLPFVRYIDMGFTALMTAHVAVPSLSGDTLSADVSHRIITDLLRKEYGFDGLVISDALNMNSFSSNTVGSVPATVQALLAGVDILLAPKDTNNALGEIKNAVRSGELPVEVLQDHCRRVLFFKYLTFYPFHS